jgi:hypothetical protein
MSVFYFYFIRFLSSVVEPEPQEPQLLEPDRNKIPFLDPAPVLEPDPVRHKMEYKSQKSQKEASFLGNTAASNIEMARFRTFFKLLKSPKSEPEPQ